MAARLRLPRPASKRSFGIRALRALAAEPTLKLINLPSWRAKPIMLIMQRPSLGGLVNHKKATYYFVALILIVLASWLGYRHFHKTPAQSLDSSNAAFIDSLNSTAQQDLKSKDYPAALQALIPAGTTAISDNNWQQARDIYLTAINKIPDKYIDWSV